MSYRALILATVDVLRTQLNLRDTECKDSPGGRPTPGCGKRFVGVSEGPGSSGNVVALDEYFSIWLTISMRTNEPFDVQGAQLLHKEQHGLSELCQAVKAVVADDYLHNTIIRLANKKYLPVHSDGTVPNGFCEGLRYQGQSEAIEKGADWFLADPKKGMNLGFAQRLQFGRARRIQALGIPAVLVGVQT